MKYVEIKIIAGIPVDGDELGHDAIVQTRDPAADIVAALVKLGLLNVTQSRRIGSTKTKAPPAAPLAVAAE